MAKYKSFAETAQGMGITVPSAPSPSSSPTPATDTGAQSTGRPFTEAEKRIGIYTPQSDDEANEILRELAERTEGISDYLNSDAPLSWEERSRYQDQITGARNQLQRLADIYGADAVRQYSDWYSDANSSIAQKTAYQRWQAENERIKTEEPETYLQALLAQGYEPGSQVVQSYARAHGLTVPETGAAKVDNRTKIQKAFDRFLGVDRTQVTGEDTNWWDIFKGSALKGLSQWSTSMWKGADWLLGDLAEDIHQLGVITINDVIDGLNYIPGVDLDYIDGGRNFFRWGREESEAYSQYNQQRFAANANTSRAAQIADVFGTSFFAAVPMAIEALMFGLAGAGGEMATTEGLTYFSGLQSASRAEAVGQMAAHAHTEMLKNPQFWTTYVQTVGDGYDDAKADGMSDIDAGLYAMINAYWNAMIEIGGSPDSGLGGIQNFASKIAEAEETGNKRMLVEWFKDSVLGEGWEEVLQGIFERGLKAPATGDPILSFDVNDTRAVFNPYTAMQEFTGGAVVGGLLGGGQLGISSGLNALTGKTAGSVQNLTQVQERGPQQSEATPAQTQQDTGAALIQQVIHNMDVPEAQAQVLAEGFEAGNADAQSYALGIQEAFRLGEMGVSFGQALDNSSYSDKLNEAQFRHAWEIGAQKAGQSTETRAQTVARQALPEYESIEAFSREFKSPEHVTAIFDQAADTDVNAFAEGFRAAYDMGQSGVSANYLTQSSKDGAPYVPTLTPEQAKAAYEMGRTDAENTALDRTTSAAAKQKAGNLTRVKGTVRGDGVTIADMRKAFNDRQNTAYRLLTRYAETTGVNIVLYNSQADAATGLYPAAQGRFQWKDDTIYIDINSGVSGIQSAGDLGQYTMLRTFAHEFTHFIEKWNATQYNEFREFVFSTMEAKGQNVHDLIETKQAQDASGNMTYEQASREVVADAMMDILPDSTLVQQLASEHRTIFNKLLEKMREFVARVKQYYRGISSTIPEAQMLKENGAYMESIVQMWDEIAKGAVTSYQAVNGEPYVDQPAKPADLPKRGTRQQVVTDTNVGNTEQPETRRAGMDFFRPVEETGEEAPKLARMAAQRNQPVSRDRFPANDFTSQAETAPDLKGMVPRAETAPSEAQEAQAAEEEPETPAEAEKPAAEEAGTPEAQTERPAVTPKGEKLRNRLDAGDSVDYNGFRYEIFGMKSVTVDLNRGGTSTGTEYRGTIRRVSMGGIPIADGRTIFDRTFDNRADAVDYMVSVAENNHLLEERTETDGRHDGAVEKGKASYDDTRLDEGGEGVRGRDSGREAAARPSELQQPERGVQEHGDGGEGDVRTPAQNDRGSKPVRNGRDDRDGDSGRLQAGSHAGGSGRKNGKTASGIQGTVPLKPRGKQNVNNHRIEEDIDSIRPNFKDNYEAIKLVKQLIAENRQATPEERAVLAKYKGWGGLKSYILDPNGYYARQLKTLLSPEEYETARDSVLNAHYTSTKVIAGIYRAVQRMGFKGGNILEPSMGVGNFFGMLPQNLSSKSSLYGVELDKITDTIAKNLYPDARIDVAGFQDVLYGDDTFDLVVGNVPFSNDIKIPYRGTKFNLHDFFFIKALDETRPGGVLALITSTGTLDKLSGKTQTAIAERANLIAAFRLPDNAFLTNAGTSVTTDLIFLQKKGPGIADNGVSFTEIGKMDGIPINEYYVSHPENILGKLAYESGMYASERTVVHATPDFEQRFNKAMDSLPKNIMDAKATTSENVSIKKRGEKSKTTYAVTDKGAALVESSGKRTELTGRQADIVKKYTEIKNLYFRTSEAEQSGNIQGAEEYRRRLNKAYDDFTAKYGTLEKNKRLLGKDDEFLRVSGLEIVDKENNVSKSAIFERPTLYREKKTSAGTSSEGLSIVLNETGRVDVGMIADLTGKTEEEVVTDLENEIILTPDGNYELLPVYLSGNIYQKLDAVEGRKGFERQAALLKTVLPKPKTARNIDAEISSHWIPPKYITQFVQEQFSPYGKFEAKYIKELGRWDMEKFYSPIRKWGTSRVDAFDVLLNTLNNKKIVVTDSNADGSRTINVAETKVAQNKQNDLRSAFREWVFKDADRRADLENIFNRTLNAYAPLNFGALADKIDFGIDPSSRIKLRDYQKAAVARIVFGGNTLLHHGVGTGKTATMITAAHVLKSTGVAQKPMFVVPNGKVLDFKREILGMYPGARILALDADMLTPKELQRTKALIATNDWDYVLIHRTGFQKIGVSQETTAAFIEQQLDDLETAIRESGATEKRGTRFEKSLITKKKNLEEKLKKILESPKDDSTTFETMGVDALFVDEAHNFKKVGFATTQTISGVDSSTNATTTDLYMKENWLRDRGGRIVLATATPITNTVSEMYNMTLHVNPDILREAGVYAFDGWLNTFGDLRSDMEIASDGKTFRMKERIQDFKNGNELISLYRQFADVKQTKDVVNDLPEAQEVTVVCSGSDFHQTLLDTFAKRMESVGRGNKDDNALNVNNDARAAATDLRMVSGLIEEMFPGTTIQDLDLPDSKINKAVGYIVDEYHKSMKNKGTQLVFLDSGMGRGKATRYKFNLYGDLISKLVKNGIPRNQIADIGDYDGDDARQKLYDLVNAGTIRVLIGSTAKMGEGVNVQNKIVALHDLSVPMRADNLEQRHGRAIRHGNENKTVRIYKYIQEKSYDSYLWQMIERKSKYMAQALNGGDASDLEEISAVTVNAQQSKALATGNPAIMEKFKLEDEVNTLRTLESAFLEENREAARTAMKSKATIAEYKAKIDGLEKVQKILSKNRKDDFEITIGKTSYEKRADAAQALFNLWTKSKATDLGSIYGLTISRSTRLNSADVEKGIVFNGNPDTFVEFGDSPDGNMTRLLNGLDRIGNSINWYKNRISNLEKTVDDAEKTAARTQFPQTKELNEKLARLEEINQELGITNDTVEINVTSAEGDEDFEEESTRRQSLSDREILSMAANDIDIDTLDDRQRNALNIFNNVLNDLRAEQEHRAELGRQYKEQQFTKGGSRQEADRIRAAMSVSDSKIKALENRLLSLENKDVLKSVLEKARRVVELEERKRGNETLKRYRERRNESAAVHKYRERVRTEVETLRKWLVNPSNKDVRKHVPAEIQKTVADFLDSINLMSKTALRTSGLDTTKADEKYLKNMKKLRDAIKKNVDTHGLYSGYADLPEGFIDTFEALIRKTEEHIGDHSGVFVVNQMSAAELRELSHALKTLKKYITTMNEFHNNAMFQHAYDAGEETVDYLSKFAKSKKSGFVHKFFSMDYMRPSYVFERFGKGGQSIEHEFREGQATQAFLANKIIDFAKETYTAKEVKSWGETVKSFTLSDGETVKVPITHIMSLYCLNKRPQALTHIYGDGIRIANYKDGRHVELDEGHLVTLGDVQEMISTLTPRQREVADALQKYMSTDTATWGNYVSMARFGVEQFTEENYFPINSDGRYLATTADETPDNAGLYALLNSSFTKELKENANNRIILYNIFDVFANHTASMTQYRSFALPVLDALKWFNYQNDTTSVRSKLSSAFGAPVDERAGSGSKGYAEQFVINLLRSYNGTAAQGDPYDSVGMKALHRFNRAQIAFNFRVVVQQPMAITRAAMLLSPAKLAKGLGMSAAQMKKLAAEMEEHSGIAAWKALGFYDTNISRGLTELIKQNPSFMDQVTEVGTKGAEVADRFTWAAMWYAAKDTVKRSDYDSEEAYYKAVTELFEDVIYKTQVVDSVLTKSEFLRAKGFFPRMLGSFMSEPMTTTSMLTSAYYKYSDDMQRGMSRSEAWKKNGGLIAKTAAVYTIGQVMLAAAQAVMDAWRDDDEYDTENWLSNFFQKYLEAFKGNTVEELLPFSKVPLLSELYDELKSLLDYAGVFKKLGLDLYGNGISNGWAQYAKYLEKGAQITIDLLQGNKTNYTAYGAIYNFLRGAAGASGFPIATAWRELQDMWNNTVGYFAPNLKLDTYQRAIDRQYIEQIRPTGLSQKTFESILADADARGDGNGSLKQDELGAELVAAIGRGEITEDQADAIWRTKWNKPTSKTFAKWREETGGVAPAPKPAATPATASTPAPAASASTGLSGYTPLQSSAPAATPAPTQEPQGVTSLEQFNSTAPLYGSDRRQASYAVWENSLQYSGMSLDRYTEILTMADMDGNGSLKQDELGYALRSAINNGEMSYEQASAVWDAQAWKHNFDYWSGRH